jgi:4-amino-4-deoxy-L-arabinose transferase-like glycosyltransferase
MSAQTPPASLHTIRLQGLSISTFAAAAGLLTLIGLGVRLAWVAYVDTIPLGGDPHWYYVVGQNIAQGHGFVANRNEVWEIPGPGEPTAFWPPGYPFALGAVFKIFGVGWTQAQVLNAVCGALAIPFVYAIGSRIFSRRVGLTAAGIFAVFPSAIAGVPVLFPEPLFVLIMLAAFWLLVSYPLHTRQAWPALVGFGVLTGIALLTRGQAAAFLPIAALYWLSDGGWRAAVRTTLLAGIIAAILIAPWTVRNAVELNAFIPISTNSGAALRVGHAPDSIGTTRWTEDEIDGFRMWESIYRPEWEVKGYREYTNRAIEYALTHPLDEVRLSGLKVYHLYRGDSSTVEWLTTLGATPIGPDGFETFLRWLIDITYYVLLFGALLSIPLWFRRNANCWLLVNSIIMWTLFHIAFLGEPRYHVPLYPVLVIMFAAGAWALWNRVAPRRATRDRGARAAGHAVA